MKKLLFFALLLFPILSYSLNTEDYIEKLAINTLTGDMDKCKYIIDEWEITEPFQEPLIKACRASILLSKGDLLNSEILMEEALVELEGTLISSKLAEILRSVYQECWKFSDYEKELTSLKHQPHIELCKRKQPKGTSLKYWLGVTQIVVGCIAAPFSAGLSTALISTGLAFTADAVCDSLNNMDQWERELNDRQRITPENINPPIQQNSCKKNN